MREPRSIQSRQITPSGYFGGESEVKEPWLVMRLARAMAEGALPLIILVAMLALFWEVSVIGRMMSLPYGIDVVQRVALVTVGGGVVVSLIVYLIAATRTLQGVREHQRNGHQLEALLTLIVLTIATLVSLYPLVHALTMAQHPAP